MTHDLNESRTGPSISVAVLVRPQNESSLRSTLNEFDAVYTRSWRELEARLVSGAFQTTVVDPGLLTDSDTRQMAAFGFRHPDLGFIAYASLVGASLHAVAQMTCDGFFFHQVLVHERDCSRSRVCRAIERASAHSFVGKVLGRLERDLSALPQTVARTLFDLFARPGRYSGVCDLATEADVKVRTLYRTFQHARLGPPKKFLTLAKICRAYFLLRNSDASVAEVAMQVGYHRASTLTENCMRIFGCTPSGLRSTRDDDELALGLLDWLYKPGWRVQRAAHAPLVRMALQSSINKRLTRSPMKTP